MKTEMKSIVLSLLLVAATTLSAQRRTREYTPSPVSGTAWNAPGNANPFIPGYFADPTIRKFGETWYLYATTDGTGNGYGPAQVWVSKDFVNWKNIVMNWPTTEGGMGARRGADAQWKIPLLLLRALQHPHR